MDSTLTWLQRHFSPDNLAAASLSLGWKVLSAIIVLLVGMIMMRLAMVALRGVVKRTVKEPTVRMYSINATRILLWTLLLIVVMSVFGIETTALAALFGAAGLAIGLALQGTLSNFASGFMLLLFRPFRAGDTIEVAGVTGKVMEIGIFSTIIDTPDNIRAFVPNGAIFTGVIKNRSSNESIRAEIRITVDVHADIPLVQKLIHEVIDRHAEALGTSKADVHVIDDYAAGTPAAPPGITLSIRPNTAVGNVEVVRTTLSIAIREELRTAGVTIVR